MNASGPIQDATNIFYSPFRKKWVYSLKQGFTSLAWTLQYRARAYVEVDDLVKGANSWTHMIVPGPQRHACLHACLGSRSWHRPGHSTPGDTLTFKVLVVS